MKKSPISKITLENREFFIKRDDLYDPYLSGNKYRKLHTLIHTPKEIYRKIVSYGGTQSNAMLAIAALCQKKGWEFTYYTKSIAAQQKTLQYGNYEDAVNLGMRHIEIKEELYRDFIASLSVTLDKQTLLVEQGGAMRAAKDGLEVLAEEIKEQLQEEKIALDSIAMPSGTGTSALFLAKALPECRVYTTPCVGDSAYLKEQMRALCAVPSNLRILEPKQKYHFAKPYREFYEIYEKLLSAGVEFDLLYAPAMWLSLLEQTQERVLYIHSGGVSGNATMRERYKKKFSL